MRCQKCGAKADAVMDEDFRRLYYDQFVVRKCQECGMIATGWIEYAADYLPLAENNEELAAKVASDGGYHFHYLERGKRVPGRYVIRP